MKKTKEIEVSGEKYILTAKRSLLLRLKELVPEALKINDDENVNNEESNKENQDINLGIILYDNMDIVFYELLKTEHPNLTKDESDLIYVAFSNEYNDVDENLLKFVYSVFTQGIPRKNKKNLNW